MRCQTLICLTWPRRPVASIFVEHPTVLTTLKEILGHARANRYAVPAFDCVEDVMVRTILETAESLRAVILMGLPADLQGNGIVYVSRLIRGVAEHHTIPIALHLDHANDLDLVRAAIDHGFTSVMVDGSSLPFDENVALTKTAVELCIPMVSVWKGNWGTSAAWISMRRRAGILY